MDMIQLCLRYITTNLAVLVRLFRCCIYIPAMVLACIILCFADRAYMIMFLWIGIFSFVIRRHCVRSEFTICHAADFTLCFCFTCSCAACIDVYKRQ